MSLFEYPLRYYFETARMNLAFWLVRNDNDLKKGLMDQWGCPECKAKAEKEWKLSFPKTQTVKENLE